MGFFSAIGNGICGAANAVGSVAGGAVKGVGQVAGYGVGLINKDAGIHFFIQETQSSGSATKEET